MIHAGGVGLRFPIISGAMALVMGIATILRLTKNMPMKFSRATSRGVSSSEFAAVLQRLHELEERMSSMNANSAKVMLEKDMMLAAALTRITRLEEEVTSTRKALADAVAMQQEILTLVDKKKKKKLLKRKVVRIIESNQFGIF